MIQIDNMPKLGFGLMRLPIKEDESVDIERVCEMVDAYIQAGFNYFDTAYMYHSGKSETVIKEALVKRYPRESYYLVDKYPIFMPNDGKTKEEVFLDQLEKTGVDYFDIYLLHAIDDENINQYEEANCFNWAKQLKEEGKIKHFGFSFHGTPECLDKILENHPEVEIVQIQLNYLDMDNPLVESRAQYEVLKKYNLPILIMEPVKGGTLANVTEDVEAMMKEVNPDKSVASWALRYAASLDNVMTVLSGMSTEEQMMDNIKTFTNFKKLDEIELETINQVVEKMKLSPLIACTNCRYCVDECPTQIVIPEVFKALNSYKLTGKTRGPKAHYKEVTENKGLASACIACGQCESVCPQHLSIIEYLKEAVETLEKE